MNIAQPIITVPLSHLSLSPKNSRKRRSAAHIAAMLESLKAYGQLQNLVVTPSDDEDHYLVDAGGTRFLALQLGVERGEIAADYPVTCRPIAAEVALEASTAENVIREDMHPAEQFKAFQSMVEIGKSTTEIAAHFSVAESVVAQRLKLANAAPDLFELYENGEMKLDQLQALALTDDHKAQRQAWFGAKGAEIEKDWQRRPAEIRKRITAREIGPDNPLAKFVGVESYEAAGGGIRRDMFSSDVYFADSALLEKLAGERIEPIAEAERASGWAWVETHLELDYSARSRYGHGPYYKNRRELSSAEKEREAEIEARLEEIDELQNHADDDGNETDGLEEESDKLQCELDQLRSAQEVWSEEAKSNTGVLIYIDEYRGLQIERGRLKPGQRINSGKVEGGKQPGPKKPELSQDMLIRLEMQRAAAIREVIASRPSDAITLLIEALIHELHRCFGENPFSISANNHHADDGRYTKFTEILKAPARIALEDRAAKWFLMLPQNEADLASWLNKLSQDKRNELLALLVALSLPVPQVDGKTLATRLGINMAEWWEPTAENYTGLVPKNLLAEAVTEVSDETSGESLLAKKKDAAIVDATKQLAGKGWLPKPLRGEGYALITDAPAPALVAVKAEKPAAKAKPKPAKKAATKKPAKPAKPKKSVKKAQAKKATKGGEKP